jgi:hypothetical protein
MELEFLMREILNTYNKFHPEKVMKVNDESWKGKSSMNIIKEIDRLIIIKFQKPDKDSKPTEIRTEITKEELSAVIDSLKEMQEPIKSKILALSYSRKLGLEHSGWRTGDNPFFSDRKNHNKFTLILGALAEQGLIEYKRGNIKLLNKQIELQNIL